MKNTRGIALITVLSVGAILAIFAGAFLVSMLNNYQAARVRQQAIQAEWNARAGLEHYRVEGLPAVNPETGERILYIKPGSQQNYCRVHLEATTGDVRFEGVSGRVHRSITLLGGVPDRMVLELR